MKFLSLRQDAALVDAVRAHLLDIAGNHEAARAYYRLAARRTLSIPEKRYLASRSRCQVGVDARPISPAGLFADRNPAVECRDR